MEKLNHTSQDSAASLQLLAELRDFLMHFIRCPWLRHAADEKPTSLGLSIYSCHVHPDGSRIATGGQDGNVRVWDTNAIYEALASDSTDPRQLCSMTNHNGAVLCVRFSGSGRYLASGSDDKIVLIWEIDTQNAGQTFGSTETHIENWRSIKRLAGHENDVQDVAWSPDSAILVSVGLDSHIFIWSGTTFERLNRLTTHQSHIKGVSFDPAGRYFSTASDDRTIKVFSTDSLTVQKSVKAPLASSPLTSYFRRCSWSPDGAHIAAPNATNGPVPCVAIINRITWDCRISLVGHEMPTEVSLFNPRLWASSKGNEKGAVTVIACSGQDRMLSVWNTSSPRPLVIAQNVATKQISDLAWSPDGMALFGCSMDGTLFACVFEEGDLGFAVPLEANNKLLEKYGYGRPMKITEGIPVPISILGNSKRNSQAPTKRIESKPFTNKVTVTKDGRKRVAPQLISVPMIEASTPISSSAPFTNHSRTPEVNGINKRKSSGPSVQSSPKRRQVEKKNQVTLRQVNTTPAINHRKFDRQTPSDVQSIVTAKLDEDLTFTIRNSVGQGLPCTVSMTRHGELIWTDTLQRRCLTSTGNSIFSAVCCEDSSLIVYSDSGTRILPPLIVESTPSFLETFNSRHLMLITKNHFLYAWDILDQKALFNRISIEPIILSAKRSLPPEKQPAISSAGITIQGFAIICINTDEAFAYVPNLSCWTRITEPAWQVAENWGTFGHGTLKSVEMQTSQNTRSEGHNPSFLANEETSIRYLETRIAAAKLLGCTDEFQETVQAYVIRMSDMGENDKIVDVMNSLALENTAGSRKTLSKLVSILGKNTRMAPYIIAFQRLLQYG